MKKIILVISALCILSLAYSQDMASVSDNESKSLNKAYIALESNSWDFGAIKQNVPVSHVFVLKNTSNVPLIIHRVATTCGCTASDFPKEAILPNTSANITITYNAASKGAFDKSATVYSNASNDVLILKVKGTVN